MAEQPDKPGSSRGQADPAKGNSRQTANLGLYFLISLGTAIVVTAAAAGINHAWPIFGTTTEKTASVVAQPTPAAVSIDVDDNPAQGPADAKVTIVEFADFQGTNCGRFALETLPQVISNYADTVRFVFMNFPLTSTNAYAQKAAEAGECANEQGAFWPYHDLLFQNQQALTDLVDSDPETGLAQVVDSLKGYAEQLGLDTAQFNDCLDSGEMVSAIQADQEAARKAAQDARLTSSEFGLPTFYINGDYLGGYVPYSVFKQSIDAALAAAE